jgi:hypothetical protein
MKFRLWAALLLASAGLAGAESLWTPTFQGYVSTTTNVRVGDILLVVVDTSSSLTFESSSNDSKNLTLEFSGGQFGNLFSFLPAVRTGGTLSVKGGQDYALQTELAVRVVDIDATGHARVQGTRGLTVQGRDEALTLSGWVDPAALGSDRRISFSALADSTLSFRTFLQPASPVLTAADIEEVVAELQAPQAAPGAPPAAPAAPGAGGAAPPQGSAAPPQVTYQLTDAKKVELFLTYINRLVDILFQ